MIQTVTDIKYIAYIFCLYFAAKCYLAMKNNHKLLFYIKIFYEFWFENFFLNDYKDNKENHGDSVGVK